jgi:hypothetical protein
MALSSGLGEAILRILRSKTDPRIGGERDAGGGMTAFEPETRDGRRRGRRWASALLAAVALCLQPGALAAGPHEGYFIAQSPWQPVMLGSGREATPISSATILHLGPGGRFRLLEVILVKDAAGAARFEAGETPWISLGAFTPDGQGATVILHNVTVNDDSSVPDELTVRTERATWSAGGMEFAGERFEELCAQGLQAEADAWFNLAEHLDRLAGR